MVLCEEEVAYIGDDIPDLCCMEICGFRGCPKDAADEIKAVCEFISSKNVAMVRFVNLSNGWSKHKNSYLNCFRLLSVVFACKAS